MQLDITDKSLLRLLQQNARYTTKELSEKLHLSATPVYERQRKLEKEGFINRYVAILNKEKLGIKLLVFCHVKLKQHERGMAETFVKAIQLVEEVMECYNISGEYDFMLKVVVADMPAYQDFIMNKLTMIENIGSTQSVFVMGEIKTGTAYPVI
ncbi:MAG: Lrp/AsnC family transcriptional regulator [Opitutaceae bacterium]|nr:Lrp/AsnC family transcriptional regulator [Cytophagales bacterium]